MREGHRVAMLVRCADDVTGAQREFIVKDLGCVDTTAAILCRELAGNLVARALGVQTPEPVVVTIGAAVAEASKYLVSGRRGPLQPGWAAGAALARLEQPMAPEFELPGPMLQEAMCLYAFDLVSRNTDRGVRNPNCALAGGHLIAYDFEACFYHSAAQQGAAPPWQVTPWSVANPDHVLREPILRVARRRNRIDYGWDAFLADLARLDAAEVRRLLTSLPAEGQPLVERIVGHLEAVRANPDGLRDHLEASLR
jgi:hypothetical protein